MKVGNHPVEQAQVCTAERGTQGSPLYHWLTVDGVHFQSYRIHTRLVPLISDDARIEIIPHGDFWVAQAVPKEKCLPL